MATIQIVELNSIGGPGAIDGSPVINLSGVIKITEDESTSGTAETITLDPETRYIVVTGNASHRLSVKSSDASARYVLTPSTGSIELAVNEKDRTLAYRTDAS